MLASAGHAYPRALTDARRNANVDRARVSVELDRQAPRRSAIRILERQIDRLLDVAPLPRARGAARAAGAASGFALFTAREKRAEEIGEGVFVAEQVAHLFSGHGAIAGALTGAAPAAEIDAPAAGVERRSAAGCAARTLRLLVHPPVRPELVIFFSLFRIAKHFVGLVDLLEPGLCRFVAGIDVGMVLPRKLAERLLDVLFRRALIHAERGVVVLEVHEESRSAPASLRPTVSTSDLTLQCMADYVRLVNATMIGGCSPGQICSPFWCSSFWKDC